jgi:hypothetical protein
MMAGDFLDSDYVHKLERQLKSLEALRLPYEPDWRRCFDATFPLRGAGLEGNSAMTTSEGRSRLAKRYDSTLANAAQSLASNLMSGLTPANSIWLGFQINQPRREDVQWMDDAARAQWDLIHGSNYSSEGYDTIMDSGIAGWGCLYIDQDASNGGLRFQEWPLPHVFVDSTRGDGRVNRVFRRFSLSPYQALAQYGKMCSEETRKKAVATDGTAFTSKVEFAQAIIPNENVVPADRPTGDIHFVSEMPFRSVTWERSTKTAMKFGGYEEFPCAIPRWSKIPYSCYGIGKVYDVLGDYNAVNKMIEYELGAAAIATTGQYVAVDDGVLQTRNLKLGPGKILVARDVNSIKPLVSGSNHQLSEVLIEKKQRDMRESMMATLFQTPDVDSKMTAYEVQQRLTLMRQLLAPVFGRFQSEYITPIVWRCFGIAFRAGVFETPPPSMRERLAEMDIKFLDPLSRAQRLTEVNALRQSLETSGAVMQILQGQDLSVLFKGDDMIREIFDLYGAPSKLLATEKEVSERRQAQAQAVEDAQAQAQTEAMAQAAASGNVEGAASATAAPALREMAMGAR